MKPTIDLGESVGLGLIVALPTGVVYSNQTGGFSCLRPGLEGAFIPLRNDCLDTWELLGPGRALWEYFQGPPYHGSGATAGLDEADADVIDALLARGPSSTNLRVDRTRLRDSHEAWVWVVISGDDAGPAPVFTALGPYPRHGVLTWQNTD